MQTDNHYILSIEETIAQRQASKKAIDGKELIAHLKTKRKSDLKRIRQPGHFKAIPASLFIDLSKLGRGKYRAIVVATYMSLLWDGWKSKKKTNRIPNNKVMFTRRMMAQHFKMSQSTAGLGIKDLVQHHIIIIAHKSVYSGKQGKNRGTLYRLPWMENPKGKMLNIYWGLLISNAFLVLSVTLQAVIILLHRLHNRSKNRLTIHPCALKQYGIHRNRMSGYIQQLVNAGLLVYIENNDYEFSWIGSDGRPDFDRMEKIKILLTHTDPAPNSNQRAKQ